MGLIVETDKLGDYKLDSEQMLWVYNGLDVMLTKEVHDALEEKLDPETTAKTYNFSLAMHGPAFTMMRRGFKVDESQVEKLMYGDPEVCRPKYRMDFTKEGMDNWRRSLGLMGRHQLLSGMQAKETKSGTKKWEVVSDRAYLQQLAQALGAYPLNYRSPKQLQKIFYETLRIPPIWDAKGKTKSPSTNNEALQKIIDKYPRGAQLAQLVIRLRDLDKKVQVLHTPRSADGRIRCTYNVVGTETGRWSSSETCFGDGTNLQNVTNELREIFVPDEGYVMFYADLEQAESRTVAYLAGDEAYINACESGDLHTTVSSMVYSIPAVREEADKPYFRHFSYRDMAKKAGHGTNYMLTPNSLARQHHVTVMAALRFAIMYLGGELREGDAKKAGLLDEPHEREGRILRFPGAFPGIRRWHEWTQDQLLEKGYLVTPFNRKRTFWGRLDDNATLREAVAYVPQSTIGDLLNIGLYNCWTRLEPEPEFQLLGQVHDAIVGQIKLEALDDFVPQVLDCMRVEVPVNGRTMVIPAEIKVGLNWRDMKKVEDFKEAIS